MSTRKFKPGHYYGPARPCRVCGKRTMEMRFDVRVQIDQGNVLDGGQHIHLEHPLPFQGERIRVWLADNR